MFVSIEGIDGSGKSTLAKRLATYFGSECFLTQEPSDSEFGKSLRELAINYQGLEEKTRWLLFEAERSEHVTKEILPALANNKIVICDRYIGSTIAYQGYGSNSQWFGECHTWRLEELHEELNWPTPDLTLYLDIDVETSLNRANTKSDVYEGNEELLSNARRGYLQLCDEREEWVLINARKSADLVFAAVVSEINRRLYSRKLLHAMEKWSQENYCAGWLVDLEKHLWDLSQNGEEPEIDSLMRKCQGWWIWNSEEKSNRKFLTLEEWFRFGSKKYGIDFSQYLDYYVKVTPNPNTNFYVD